MVTAQRQLHRGLRREREGEWDRLIHATERTYPHTANATMSVSVGGDVPEPTAVFSEVPCVFLIEYLGRKHYESPILAAPVTWGQVWQTFVDGRNHMQVAGRLDEYRFLERVRRLRTLGGAVAVDLLRPTGIAGDVVDFYQFQCGS